MKILVACSFESVYNVDSNPYVLALIDGLRSMGHQVDCGLDLFWNNFKNYDILYFQWPESIFDWKSQNIDIERLSCHFDEIKKSGIKSLVTCHNLYPHNHDKKTVDLYNLVYSVVDAFHHMGNYSYRYMKKKYPDKYHFVAPHHFSENQFHKYLDSAKAKTILRIPANNIVISSFGAFRNKSEERLFVEMAKDIGHRGYTYLAPRIPVGHVYNGRWINRSVKSICKRLCFKYLGIRYAGFLPVDVQDIWISASDIVFLQRIDILNSGNVPFAFSAGKIVVGPNSGNVGEILNETNNFIFDPSNRQSVKDSVIKAIDSVKRGDGLAQKNLEFMHKNWTTSNVCSLISMHLSILVGL